MARKSHKNPVAQKELNSDIYNAVGYIRLSVFNKNNTLPPAEKYFLCLSMTALIPLTASLIFLLNPIP